MEAAVQTSILRKTGAALAVVGLVDIAVMVYCVINRIAYSSSLNIFAVIAGVFLWRGNLTAASLVRWFAIFLLATLAVVPFVWPLVQPVELTLTQFRLAPTFATLGFVVYVALIAFLFWLQHQLGSAPVVQAGVVAGLRTWNMRIPLVVGLALPVLLFGLISLLFGGASAEKARSVARQQLGSNYEYHVSSLSISTDSQGTHVVGVVTAWNPKEIRSVPVEWRE